MDANNIDIASRLGVDMFPSPQNRTLVKKGLLIHTNNSSVIMPMVIPSCLA